MKQATMTALTQALITYVIDNGVIPETLMIPVETVQFSVADGFPPTGLKGTPITTVNKKYRLVLPDTDKTLQEFASMAQKQPNMRQQWAEMYAKGIIDHIDYQEVNF